MLNRLFLFIHFSFSSCCLFAQNNRYHETLQLNENKHYNESINVCTNELNKLDLKDSMAIKFLLLRIDSYRELQNYVSCIKDYLLLAKIHPEQILNYLNLSYYYGQLQDYDNCFKFLNRGLLLDPKNASILSNLSYYSSQVGKYNDAIDYANKGLKYAADSSSRAYLLTNRGYGYIGLKKYTISLIDINEAIRLEPDNSFAYCFRAIAYINLKNFATVCADLNKAKNLGGVILTKDLIKQYCTN